MIESGDDERFGKGYESQHEGFLRDDETRYQNEQYNKKIAQDRKDGNPPSCIITFLFLSSCGMSALYSL